MSWKRQLACAAILTIGGALIAIFPGDLGGTAKEPNRWVWVGLLAAFGGAVWMWEAVKGRRGPAPAPVMSVYDPDAAYGPAVAVPLRETAPPVPGERVGAVRVEESTPFRLTLGARSVIALVQMIGGLAGLAVLAAAALLAIRGVVRFTWNDWEMIALPAGGGALALSLGLPRLGVRYVFDGRARTASRQRLIGPEDAWTAADVNHIRLTIAPARADAWFGRERLIVTLVGLEGRRLWKDPLCGRVWTRTPAAAASVRLASAAARLLDVPLRLEGSTEKCSDELKSLLSGVAVEKA